MTLKNQEHIETVNCIMQNCCKQGCTLLGKYAFREPSSYCRQKTYRTDNMLNCTKDGLDKPVKYRNLRELEC